MLGENYQVMQYQGLSSFLFDKWNFYFKLPIPRILETIGNKYLPNLALGNLLLVRKNIKDQRKFKTCGECGSRTH